MSESENELPGSANRRAFLTNAMTAGAAIAGATLMTGCATGKGTLGAQTASGTATRASSEPESPQWDMSWQQRLGRYRTVYDAPEPAEGTPMYTVSSVIAGYKAALPKSAKEFTPVLVLRHTASITTVNDEMWKRLKGHERLTPKETSSKYAERNPFLVYKQGATDNIIDKDSSLTALMEAGTIILVCNRALNAISSALLRSEADKFKTREEALAEVRRNLHPGIIPMPNGLFAVCAAQDAGCGYMRIIA